MATQSDEPTLEDVLERSTKVLLGKLVQTVKPEEALRYTQAVLNLAQANQLLSGTSKK